MSIVNVHPDEYADLVMAYLLDMVRNEEMRPDNERFKKFIDKMGDRGLKILAYQAFLEMNTDTRIKYKRMKDSITADGKGGTRIVISKGETDHIKEEEEFDRELCKQVFRKIKELRFKHPSKVLTEDRIDKIIDYCVEKKKHKEEQNG